MDTDRSQIDDHNRAGGGAVPSHEARNQERIEQAERAAEVMERVRGMLQEDGSQEDKKSMLF